MTKKKKYFINILLSSLGLNLADSKLLKVDRKIV